MAVLINTVIWRHCHTEHDNQCYLFLRIEMMGTARSFSQGFGYKCLWQRNRRLRWEDDESNMCFCVCESVCVSGSHNDGGYPDGVAAPQQTLTQRFQWVLSMAVFRWSCKCVLPQNGVWCTVLSQPETQTQINSSTHTHTHIKDITKLCHLQGRNHFVLWLH